MRIGFINKDVDLYDETGVKIQDGDLLQVFHFVHYIRREKQYMYKIAKLIDGYWYGVDLRSIISDFTENSTDHHKYHLSSQCDERGIIRGTRIIQKQDVFAMDELRKTKLKI